MGDNLNPLDELKKLDQQVDAVADLAALRPIFLRLDEIAKDHADDFEVQLVVGDIKQHLVNRGTRLKAEGAATPSAAPPPTVRLTPGAMPPPMPPSGPPPMNAPPTVKMNPPAAPPDSRPTVKLSPQGPPPLPPTIAVRNLDIPKAPEPPKPPPPPEMKAPPEMKPPSSRLMSSGQFGPPTPAVGPPPIGPVPPARPPEPPRVAPPTVKLTPGATLPTAQSPIPTGQQPPMGPPSNVAGLTSGLQPPPRPPSGPPKTLGQEPSSGGLNWKRPLLLGAMLGAVVSIALIVLLVNQARKRNRLEKEITPTTIQADIATTPTGASIKVNGETKCTAPCKLELAPGSYQLMAFLDGYEPATAPLNVSTGQPASANLVLTAQAQAVRILTDLDQGKIVIDDQPAADLQDGQFIIDKVPPGSHTVKISGKNAEASFTFLAVEAKAPAVTGPVTTRNMVGVLVSSLGNQARVTTSTGPIKIAVNGQPEGDASPAGVDLKTFQAGTDEIVVGEGKDQRNMKENFGPAPMLTAFFKSDLNIGTLIVSTGEDDVRVFINGNEYRRRTQRGQLRIPAIGEVNVRVVKDGFVNEPAQTAQVKKGAEVRLEFKLKPMPQTTQLQIRGGTPGAEVVLDQTSIGTVGPDGNFTYNSVAPGDHTIELRRDGFSPKRITRTFRMGQPLALGGADVALAVAAATNGTVRLARTPENATVTYRRSDEQQGHEFRGTQLDLPAGSYVITGRAPGYSDKTERLQIAAGETRTVEIALARATVPAPTVKPGDITDFEDPAAWRKDGELWVHRGGGFVPYKMGPKGIYTFTVELLKGGNVFKGGRIRWCVDYIDAKTYLLYELDKKNFWAEVVEKGKKFEREKTQHDLDKQKAFTIQIEVTPEHVVHRIQNNGQWVVLDSFAEPGRNFANGKFGFLIQGSDEIGITNFNFTPR